MTNYEKIMSEMTVEKLAELINGFLQGPGCADFFLGDALGGRTFELRIACHFDLGFYDLAVFPEIGRHLAQGSAEILAHGLHCFVQALLLLYDFPFRHVMPVQKALRVQKVKVSQGDAGGNGRAVEVCAGHRVSLQGFRGTMLLPSRLRGHPVRRRKR